MHSQSQRPGPVMFRAGLILPVTLVALAGMAAAPAETRAKTSSTSRPRNRTRSRKHKEVRA